MLPKNPDDIVHADAYDDSPYDSTKNIMILESFIALNEKEPTLREFHDYRREWYNRTVKAKCGICNVILNCHYYKFHCNSVKHLQKKKELNPDLDINIRTQCPICLKQVSRLTLEKHQESKSCKPVSSDDDY